MSKISLRVGIIGCGLIGEKRAKVILDSKQDRVAGVYDINKRRMKELAKFTGAKIYSSWQGLAKDPQIDCVIVAAYHKILPKMSLLALSRKKHVLAEKPLGNSAREAKRLYEMSRKNKKILKVGFNHRFHPALSKARQLYQAGRIGKILYIRSVYGHGGRKNYDLEWRIRKEFSRGGEMYDQGSHIIDLAYWFLGPFASAFATAKNYFWKKTALEDNGFCQLISKTGQTVMFQVSLTQWKNRFNFEIYGDKGYLLVNGLGRSYGAETLTYGSGVGRGKPPKEKIWEFPGKDNSWRAEWQNFRRAIKTGRQPMSSAGDNYEVMKAMDALYKAAEQGKLVKI